MLIQEELKDINEVIKELALFIRQDDYVKPDFADYIKTIGVGSDNSVQFQAACFNYIFERNLGEDHKSIFDLYLEKTQNISESTKNIVEALKKTLASVFEVKKVLKNGFELYNIINEKVYNTHSLVKMTSFRGIGSGQYVVARIFKFKENYYLLEISGVLAASRKDEAYRYAVAKIVQNPELVYFDNPEKQKEIEDEVNSIYKKFIEYFNTDEIITTNKFADDVIGLFNDYSETGEKADYQDKIRHPDIWRFFNVKEFNNNYTNFLENSLGGFSSHEETYDVGIVFDKELGLYAVPFWGTFDKIFEAEDPSAVENAEQCIGYFLMNDKVPANLLKKAASKHENFMDVINKYLGTSLTFDELMQKYKSRYLDQKLFSSTTVLYKSKAFSQTLGIIEEHEERPKIDTHNVGRNEPCPCGSGKKFKKCCGANL